MNLLKVFSGYYVSRLIRKPVIWGYPCTLSIEPTNICNLHCPECPSGTGALTRKSGMMDFDSFKLIIDQCCKNVFYLQLFFQGEPFLNPDLFRMIDYSKGKKIFTSVSTNGHFIEKNIDQIIASPPDKLILSVDGLDEDSYQSYRKGGSFTKVLKGLELIAKKKKEGLHLPIIEYQFIVMKQNEHLLGKVHSFSKNYCADKVVLKTMQVSSYDSGVQHLPLNRKYSRYTVKDKSLSINNSMPNKCFPLWRTSVITWDGTVVPCCYDKDAKYKMGTLNGESLTDIWSSEKYKFYRNKILSNRKSIDICTNCTEGMKK